MDVVYSTTCIVLLTAGVTNSLLPFVDFFTAQGKWELYSGDGKSAAILALGYESDHHTVRVTFRSYYAVRSYRWCSCAYRRIFSRVAVSGAD